MSNDDSDSSPRFPPPPPTAPPEGYYGPPPAGTQIQQQRYGPVGKSNGLAIASMVLGIVSLAIAFFVFFISWIGSTLALIFGYVANRQIARSGGTERGRGMAITGIVLGWVGSALALAVITVFALVAILGDDGESSSSSSTIVPSISGPSSSVPFEVTGVACDHPPGRPVRVSGYRHRHPHRQRQLHRHVAGHGGTSIL